MIFSIFFIFSLSLSLCRLLSHEKVFLSAAMTSTNTTSTVNGSISRKSILGNTRSRCPSIQSIKVWEVIQPICQLRMNLFILLLLLFSSQCPRWLMKITLQLALYSTRNNLLESMIAKLEDRDGCIAASALQQKWEKCIKNFVECWKIGLIKKLICIFIFTAFVRKWLNGNFSGIKFPQH